MVRGNYEVEGSRSGRKDVSFKSCVVTLFIVFLICIIIILILWQTKSDGEKQYTPQDDSTKGTGSKLDAYVVAPQFPSSTKPTTVGTTEQVPSIPITVTTREQTTSKPTTVTTTKQAKSKPIIVATTGQLSSKHTTVATTEQATSKPTTLATTVQSDVTTASPTTVTTIKYKQGIIGYQDTTETTSVTQPQILLNETSSDSLEGNVTTFRTLITSSQDTVSQTSHSNYTDTTDDKPATTDTVQVVIVSQAQTTEQTTTQIPVFTTSVAETDFTTVKTVSVVTQKPSTVSFLIPTLVVLKENDTCNTSDCKILASRMLSLMNHTMDPCNNFYEYSCGGLRENHALLQEDPEQDVWNRIASALGKIDNSSIHVYQEFQHFYDQCVKYEYTVNHTVRLKLAKKVVTDVDVMYNSSGWMQAVHKFDLTELLVTLFHIDSALLFDVSLDVDPYDKSRFQLKLTIPRSKSKVEAEARCKSHVHFDDPHNIDMNSVYQTKYLPCLGDFSEYFTTLKEAVVSLQLYESTDLDEHIENITSFTTSHVFIPLQNIEAWRIRINTLEKNFTAKTVEHLQNKYQEVNWERLLGALSNTSVDKDTKVLLYFEDYFDKLFSKLKVTFSDRIGRHIIHNALLAMLAHDIYVDLVKPRPCDREEYCLRIASELMRHASSSLYLSTFATTELNDKEQKMNILFDQLRDILNEEISKASWLDQASRSNLLHKLQNMTVVAHNSRSILLDNKLMNSSFVTELDFRSNHFENTLHLQRYYRKTLYGYIGLDPATPEAILFFFLPSDTYPTSVYELNTIILPLGMVGPWKQAQGLPTFVFKTLIGNSISRQMLHHFDTTGIRYNSTGNDMHFLEGTSHDAYVTNYVKCEEAFQDQKLTWTSQKNVKYVYQVNAVHTMNEHFTDNSAIWLTHKLINRTAASDPLLPWLEKSYDELYFLLLTQEFCAKAGLLDYTTTMFETEHFAPHLRAKVLVENSEIFRDAFKCPVSTTHSLDWKCAPFPETDVNPV